jgi:hypothetical protein
MVSLRVLVESGSLREPYVYLNDSLAACAGIISDIYTYPLLNATSAELSTTSHILQPRFGQWNVEHELRQIFTSVPVWVSSRCLLCLRRLFCSSRLPRPELKILAEVLKDSGYDPESLFAFWRTSQRLSAPEAARILNYSFYAPSYPHQSICEDYLSACGSFLERARLMKGISSAVFVGDCAAKLQTVNGISEYTYAFPSGGYQTVEILPLMVIFGNGSAVVTMTSSNRSSDVIMLNVTTRTTGHSRFSTQCPHGFVVPEDESHPRNHWIEGTGCAEACRYQIVM